MHDRQWQVSATLLADTPRRTVIRWQQTQVAVLKIAVRRRVRTWQHQLPQSPLLPPPPRPLAVCVFRTPMHTYPTHFRATVVPRPLGPLVQAVFVEQLVAAPSVSQLFVSLARPAPGANTHARIIAKVVANCLSFSGAGPVSAGPVDTYVEEEVVVPGLAGVVVDGVGLAAAGVMHAATEIAHAASGALHAANDAVGSAMGAAVGVAKRLFDHGAPAPSRG